MAVVGFVYSIRNSANTTTDNRATGLSPTVSNGKTLASIPASITASGNVSVVELGAGDYLILYDAEVNGDGSFPVDWGSSLTNPNDRYGTLVLTRDSGRILAGFNAVGQAALSASGLDAITIETGVNMRQAQSPILAAAGGVLSGAGTGTVVIKGGSTSTTRITATTDNAGNRTAVTLSLPT